MSERWSSFEKDGLLMESWRHHLAGKPEPVQELFGRKKREDKWAAIASGEEPQKKPQKCPPGCCPCEDDKQATEEYPATHFTDLFKTVDDVNRRLGQAGLNKDALFKELEQLFKDQNFVVQEELYERRGTPGEIDGAATILARQPVYDLSNYPTLAKLVQAATQDAALAKALNAAFVAAGFEGVNIAPAAAPQPPEEEEEEAAAAPPTAKEPESMDDYDQPTDKTAAGKQPEMRDPEIEQIEITVSRLINREGTKGSLTKFQLTPKQLKQIRGYLDKWADSMGVRPPGESFVGEQVVNEAVLKPLDLGPVHKIINDSTKSAKVAAHINGELKAIGVKTSNEAPPSPTKTTPGDASADKDMSGPLSHLAGPGSQAGFDYTQAATDASSRKRENQAHSDQVLLEKWQRLAGILTG